MKTKSLIYFLSFLGFVPLALWCYWYIDYDLWYDEVYSLEHFALTDFHTTFLYYPAPNNHIFFNFTSQLISRLLGFRDIFSVEENVYFFRGFQLVISIVTAFYSGLLIRNFFSVKSGHLIFIILFTTIPFMNFSLQLRGYNLSGLFVVMLAYYILNYLEYKKKASLCLIIIGTALLLYTIPSNLYVLMACGFSLFVLGFYFEKKGITIPIRIYGNIILFLTFGTLLAALLYYPIWKDVVFNRYSNSVAPGIFYSVGIMVEVLRTFFSARYLLLLLMLPGLLIFLKTATTKEKGYFLLIVTIFAAPFVVSFFHQKSPFSRVFVPLAPLFSILVTLLISSILDIKFSFRSSRILQLLIIGYCTFVFAHEISNNDKLIAEKMVEKNIMSQDLYRNFYLAEFYRQDQVMQQLNNVYSHFPVIRFQQRDEPSTDLYLRKYTIPSCEIYTIDELAPFLEGKKPVFILTSYKNRVLEELKTVNNLTISVITPDYSFTNIIKVQQN